MVSNVSRVWKSKETLAFVFEILLEALWMPISTFMKEVLQYIDPMQKWLPLYYSFIRIKISLFNLVFETKIVKNLLSRTRLVRLF